MCGFRGFLCARQFAKLRCGVSFQPGDSAIQLFLNCDGCLLERGAGPARKVGSEFATETFFESLNMLIELTLNLFFYVRFGQCYGPGRATARCRGSIAFVR